MSARLLLNRIVRVNFRIAFRHDGVFLALLRAKSWCLSKPENCRTSLCESREFSNTLARAETLNKFLGFGACATYLSGSKRYVPCRGGRTVQAAACARCGELCKLEYSEVDAQNLRIYINKPEKRSRARAIPVNERTIARIMSLPRKYETFAFNPNVNTLRSTFERSRRRLAAKLQMPNLLSIHFHSMRRFFADQLYKKSRFNTRKVQAKLGHKRLSSTEIHFGDFDADNCTYETARAETIEQAEKIRQEGYECYDSFVVNGKTVKLYSRLN